MPSSTLATGDLTYQCPLWVRSCYTLSLLHFSNSFFLSHQRSLAHSDMVSIKVPVCSLYQTLIGNIFKTSTVASQRPRWQMQGLLGTCLWLPRPEATAQDTKAPVRHYTTVATGRIHTMFYVKSRLRFHFILFRSKCFLGIFLFSKITT